MKPWEAAGMNQTSVRPALLCRTTERCFSENFPFNTAGGSAGCAPSSVTRRRNERNRMNFQPDCQELHRPANAVELDRALTTRPRPEALGDVRFPERTTLRLKILVRGRYFSSNL